MADPLPYFSVVLPTFNRERTIGGAIQSVIDQSFQDWELIIVDDCSTDATTQVISAFKDARIKWIRNSSNRGPAFSRNRGIEIARGQVISFLDSDDRYLPEFLQKTQLFFSNANQGMGFCWTGLEVKYKSGTKRELWKPVIQESPYYTFLKELRIGTNSGLSVSKEVFLTCGMFDEALKAAEDTEFLLRIVQRYGFGIIEEVLIYIDKSGRDRVSLNYEKNAASYNKFIHQHWSVIDRYPELQKKFYYKLMWLNYHLGNFSLARNYYRKYKREFGFSKKVVQIRMLFEVFGKTAGSKAHIFFSS